MPDLAEDAREADESGQPDNTGGCMLALYPPPDIAASLTLPDGFPADEIHLTVAYAGKAAGTDPQALHAAARQLAAREPFTVTISGSARFTGGETDVLVALADSPALEDLRRDAMDRLGAQGIAIPRDHGYTPHLTRRYADPGDPDPGRLEAFPVTFTAISVMHGKTRTDYPFADPLAESAKLAYAQGWALSGGPMTDRVKAGCSAAVAHVLEHRGEPGILELALDLGSLAGVWATVYKRREDLTAAHIAKISVIWRKLVRRLKPRDLIAAYRRDLIMAEADDGKPSQRQRDAAVAAALAWLQQIMSGPRYADLADAIGEALTAAAAEGMTATLAVAADQAKAAGFDWDRAYDAMLATLQDSRQAGAAGEIARRIIAAAAADAGRALAASDSSGSSDAETAAAVMDAVDGEEVGAVTAEVDYGTGQGFGLGSVGLAASEGILLNFMTAGDGRVCPVCQDCEDNGPYDPADFPEIPQHRWCRCAPSPAQPLPLSAFADFLVQAA